MSTFGRRGSRETGWNWSRPPAGPGRPPSPPPLLPLAGAALLFAAIAAALLAVWLSDSGNVTPPPPTATPAATATPTATAVPTPTPAATAEPSPTPSPTPAAHARARLQSGRLGPAAPGSRSRTANRRRRFGKARPSPSCCESATPGRGSATRLIRYTCKTLQFLSGFDRDSGSGPALAPGGPPSALPDSTVAVPDDPATPADDGERGRLSLWGGSFGPVELAGSHAARAHARGASTSSWWPGGTPCSCSGAPS